MRHLLTLVSNMERDMKKALMIAAIVLAGSAGAAVAGTSQQHHKQHPGDAATKSMNRGTSANGGVGTGGLGRLRAVLGHEPGSRGGFARPANRLVA